MRPIDPAWRRAPVVLLRFPGVLAALLGTALALGLAAASAPFFLASGEGAALQGELERVEPRFAGLTATTVVDGDVATFEAADAALREAAARTGVLAEGALQVLGGFLVTGEADLRVRPIAMTGAIDALDPIAGGGTDGAWLPERVAIALGVGPGDELELRGVRSATVRVAGVHADLDPYRLPPFWQEIANLIVPRETGAAIEPPPPPLLVFDAGDLLALRAELGSPARASWSFPLAAQDLSAAEAAAFARRVDVLAARSRDDEDPLGVAMVAASGSRGQIRLDSAMREVVRRTRTTTSGLVGPVRTLGLAGQLVALLVVGAAAAFRARRRRVELRLFHTRGVGPAAQGARAVVEAGPPVLVGAALGWVAARVGVAALGPSSHGVGAAGGEAAAAVAIATGVGLLAIALVTALAVARESREATARSVVRAGARAPWEAVVLALAGAAWYQLARGGSAVVTEAGQTQVDVLLLAFPLLLLVGMIGLAVRGVRRLLPRARGLGAAWSIAPYLALRRLTGASTTAVVLVAAGALSLGVLVYAGAISGSAVASAEAKAQVVTGSDVAISLPRGVDRLEPMLSEATVVGRGTAILLPADVIVDVIAIDPATYADGVRWDDRYAATPLSQLLAALPGSGGDRVPAIIGGEVPAPEAVSLRSGRYALELREVARADVVPGQAVGRPAVMVDRATFTEHFASSGGTGDPQRVLDPQLWARGGADRALGFLEGRGVPALDVALAEAVRSQPEVRAVGWALGYLRALGLVAALLALICTLLYLQERQRGRDVAYALTSRMGLTPGMHRRAVALEIAGMLLLALALGGLLALLAARLVVGEVDPLPLVPLAPSFALPGGTLAGALAAVGAVCVVGAALVQRAADRASFGEVLRAAE